MTKNVNINDLGELLPIVTLEKNGLVDKNFGLYKQDTVSDLNNLKNGYCSVSGSVSNTPESDFYGIVIAYRIDNAILQHAYSAATHKVYERVNWDGWKPWFQL